jgi:drug/metabolite transporter (DMT)-like permease
LKADLLLLVTAAIWGFAFVAQRVGMDSMGPFTFNAIRFILGALVLLPFSIQQSRQGQQTLKSTLKTHPWQIVITGLALFGGASLQQIGLVGTTAGKAGFITGLYVILVPLLALLWGGHTHPAHWAGAIFAVAGLYLLSVKAGFQVSPYDLVVLAGAFVWAGHVHLIDRFSAKVGPIRLSIFQFAICGILSAITAILFEPIVLSGIADGFLPVLYGGFLSVGLAYTLQVVAQRTANPFHAVIIMSLEGVFAALGGWLLLDELLTNRDLIGSALILGGMLISQIFAKDSVQKDAPVTN